MYPASWWRIALRASMMIRHQLLMSIHSAIETSRTGSVVRGSRELESSRYDLECPKEETWQWS